MGLAEVCCTHERVDWRFKDHKWTQENTMVTISHGLGGWPKLSQTVQMLVGTLQQWVRKEAILVTLLPLSKAAQVGHAMASMRLSCKGTCNIASLTKMQ